MVSLERPLSGVTVIDMTRILSGPHCTRILADLGARVIKCEPPAGDPTRSFAARIKSPATKCTASSYFAQVNAGKESIEMDLTTEGDRDLLERLLERSLKNFKQS